MWALILAAMAAAPQAGLPPDVAGGQAAIELCLREISRNLVWPESFEAGEGTVSFEGKVKVVKFVFTALNRHGARVEADAVCQVVEHMYIKGVKGPKVLRTEIDGHDVKFGGNSDEATRYLLK